MSSPRGPGADLARFYTVTDPQRHPRGYTVYKVTARVVSRKNPEDVQEITVWKRYSDFKKLHKELWQIHKHLFRHSELFPPFAKGIVFGRFDETVIEERRQCAEDLLQFSANIPALYNSKQLQDFFKGGLVQDGSELIGPAEACSDSLIDTLAECSTEGFSSDSDLVSLTVDVDSLAEGDDGMASSQNSPLTALGPGLSPDCPAPGVAASNNEQNKTEEERESRSLFAGSLKSRLGKRDYLEQAGELIKLALKKEGEEDYEVASEFYRKGVDLLLEGVQGESSPSRREAVKRRTAEYLTRAESLCTLRGKPQPDAVSQPPGSLSSRPPWNLRSPAEELKAFRVLGVIDKVLLVMDTRTEQTFILKGLRKSSEYSGSRKTIIPRCVPNMVCLHKYIVSEEAVFLVLQHAEGGKLWSYVSKFLNRSPEDSFAVEEVRAPSLRRAPLQQAAPQDSGSFGSRGSEAGTELRAVPLQTSLTPSSQDESAQEDEGQASPPQWPDSGSSSEEECTTSYLTLCTEYGQEKVEPGSLEEESESLLVHQAVAWEPSTLPRAPQQRPLPPEDDLDAVYSERTSDSLQRSRNSPLEFFRIDSRDSSSELLGLDFGEKLCGLKSEPPRPLFPLADRESSTAIQDTDSRGSDDSVPLISFKDAAFDDVGGPDEGRPDLLVNLPGEPEPTRDWAAEGTLPFAQVDLGRGESRLLEAPDVLCLKLGTDWHHTHEQMVLGMDPSGAPASRAQSRAEQAPGVPLTDHSGPQEEPLSQGPSPELQGLLAGRPGTSAGESPLCLPSRLPGTDEGNIKPGEVLLFSDTTEVTKDSAKESGPVCQGHKEIHQIFEDLDKKLALSSRLHIPEGCVQRWAAEMVVALDALHREGIVCRDLNPNNILLNDRGHIQLTYFSRWSEVEDSCDSEAVERMYCAPEVGAITEETEACDWWSLGAVLFELLTGKTLAECHPAGITTHTTLNMPECISEEARSLVQQLLQFNPVERLGAGVAGVEDIKSHPFFTPVDWTELMR